MILDLFRKDIGFDNIHGYDDIKNIVRRALDAEDNYNLLFVGPTASAKTLFLLGILESKKGVYFDGSNTTNRILDVLEEKRPKIICIDELDKMPKQFQEKLLNFMESGHIKVDQMRRQYDFTIKGAKVFAACNEITRLSRITRLPAGFLAIRIGTGYLCFVFILIGILTFSRVLLVRIKEV